MKDLKQKKAEIQRKMKVDIISAEFEHEICSQFPELKILAYARDWKGIEKTANFELNKISEFKKVFEKYPPTNAKTIIGYAGKDSTEINHPLKMDLENPPTQNSSQRFEVRISYQSDEVSMRVTLPISEINDFVTAGHRSVTSSEYHYFTGVSQRELNKMQLCSYNWVGMKQIGWYGGNKTLTDVDMINEIVNHLNN